MATAKRLPPATVIVPTRDRHGLALEAVESIAQSGWQGVEIVVVDQSGAANPAFAGRAQIGRCRLTYRHSASVGLARARNEGIAAAGNNLLVFTDDDVLATRDWLAVLVGSLVVEGDGAVVTGSVHAGDPEITGAFAPSTITADTRTIYAGRLASDVLAGGNMALFKSALDAIGHWDERLGAGTRFPAAEDNDLGLRLLEAGFRIVYEPKASVVHRAWRPKHDYLLVRWRYGRGKGGFYAKHRDLPHIRQRARADVLHRFGRIPADALRARTRAVGNLLYVAGTACGAIEWVALAERRGRLRGIPSDVFRHVLALLRLARARLSSRRVGIALVYHRLAAEEGDPEQELVPAIAVATFRRQLRHLSRRYKVVRTSELVDAVASRRRGDRVPVAITFDDDLLSHRTHAAPVLRDIHLPATFFLGSAVRRRIGPTGGSSSRPRAMPASSPPPSFRMSTKSWWRGRKAGFRGRSAARRCHRKPLRKAAPPHRPAPGARRFRNPGLTRSDVAHLDGAGVRDRLPHCPPRLAPRARRRRSPRRSRRRSRRARQVVGIIRLLAYPHGRADRRVARAAAERFDFAFTGAATPITPGSDPHLLGRLEAPLVGGATFALRLASIAAQPEDRASPVRNGQTFELPTAGGDEATLGASALRGTLGRWSIRPRPSSPRPSSRSSPHACWGRRTWTSKLHLLRRPDRHVRVRRGPPHRDRTGRRRSPWAESGAVRAMARWAFRISAVSATASVTVVVVVAVAGRPLGGIALAAALVGFGTLHRVAASSSSARAGGANIRRFSWPSRS